MCKNRACAVTTIEDEESIPLIWRVEELSKLEGPKAPHPLGTKNTKTSPLDGALGQETAESCIVEQDECDERDYCVPENESAGSTSDYVSLIENPERFTGYAGDGAQNVWKHVYQESCFLKPVASPNGIFERTEETRIEFDNDCLEKRAFYRLVSGMHASISLHLCWDYLNQTTGDWAPNLDCFIGRFGLHLERLQNVYFNYAVLLRAVSKMQVLISSLTFCAGDESQDRVTKSKVLKLVSSIPTDVFDESAMFKDEMFSLKEDFRNRFRSVSRIMDCVSCDKCRLWGKVQTQGYGTALKILFEFEESADANNPPLRRTELVALVNTLDRVSHSLQAIQNFQSLWEARNSTGQEQVVNGEKQGQYLRNGAQQAVSSEGLELELERRNALGEMFKRQCGLVWEHLYNSTVQTVGRMWGACVGRMGAASAARSEL